MKILSTRIQDTHSTFICRFDITQNNLRHFCEGVTFSGPYKVESFSINHSTKLYWIVYTFTRISHAHTNEWCVVRRTQLIVLVLPPIFFWVRCLWLGPKFSITSFAKHSQSIIVHEQMVWIHLPGYGSAQHA